MAFSPKLFFGRGIREKKRRSNWMETTHFCLKTFCCGFFAHNKIWTATKNMNMTIYEPKQNTKDTHVPILVHQSEEAREETSHLRRTEAGLSSFCEILRLGICQGNTLDIQNPPNTWWGSVFGTPKGKAFSGDVWECKYLLNRCLDV